MTARRPGSRALMQRLRPIVEERPAFVEGLLIGAMVGAAIAGSTLWSRLRQARHEREDLARLPARTLAEVPAPPVG